MTHTVEGVPSRRRKLAFLLLLFVASFLVRWRYVSGTEMIGPIRADAREYVAIAQNLVLHGVWNNEPFPGGSVPVSSPNTRAPGYPFFLTLVLRTASVLQGPRWLPDSWVTSLSSQGITSFTPAMEGFLSLTLLLQCLMGAGVAVLSVLLARIWTTEIWAWTVGLLTMVSPHLISFSNYFLTEALFTFLFILALLLTARAFENESALRWLWAGLALGAAIFVRPTVELLPFAFLALVLLRYRENRALASKAAAYLLAGSFLLLGPWTVWSSVRFSGAPKPRSLTRVAFYQGTYPGLVYRNPQLKGMVYRDDPGFFPIVDAGWGRTIGATVERFSQDPLRMTWWFLAGKPAILWGWSMLHQTADAPGGDINEYPAAVTWYDVNPLQASIKGLMKWIHWPLVVLMHLGLLLLGLGKLGMDGWRRWGLYVLAVSVAYFWIIHVALTPAARYALPLRPVMYLLAILALSEAVIYARRSAPRWLSRKGILSSS